MQTWLAWGGLVAGAFLFCYAGVIQNLTRQWWMNPVYSYGFLIPVISGYLVWTRRSRLRTIPVRSSLVAGILTLTGGLGLLVAGHAAGLSLVEDFSTLVVLSGACLLVLGAAQFRALLFPLGYLVFMVPAWDFFTTRLHPPLQLFAARVGIAMLDAVGIPVAREGTKILLPHRTLEVAEACSGVNFLIAVIAIGIPLAALTLRGWTRRILLVAFGVAVAIGSNSVRVALIGVLSYLGIAGDVHGPGHVLQGMFVAVIGYVALFLGAWFLSRGEAKRRVPEPRPGTPADPGPSARKQGSIALPATLVCAALVGAGAYLHGHQSRPVPLTHRLSDFPRSLGAWVGEEPAPDDTLFASIQADSTLLRRYRRGADEAVLLFVGYDASQRERPNVILEGTRPLHVGAVARSVRLDSGETLRINEVVKTLNNRTCAVIFWYVINGRATENRIAAKLYTGWDDIARGQTDGAVVGVMVGCRTPEERSLALDRAATFAGDALPLIRRFLSSD